MANPPWYVPDTDGFLLGFGIPIIRRFDPLQFHGYMDFALSDLSDGGHILGDFRCSVDATWPDNYLTPDFLTFEVMHDTYIFGQGYHAPATMFDNLYAVPFRFKCYAEEVTPRRELARIASFDGPQGPFFVRGTPPEDGDMLAGPFYYGTLRQATPIRGDWYYHEQIVTELGPVATYGSPEGGFYPGGNNAQGWPNSFDGSSGEHRGSEYVFRPVLGQTHLQGALSPWPYSHSDWRWTPTPTGFADGGGFDQHNYFVNANSTLAFDPPPERDPPLGTPGAIDLNNCFLMPVSEVNRVWVRMLALGAMISSKFELRITPVKLLPWQLVRAGAAGGGIKRRRRPVYGAGAPTSVSLGDAF